MSKQFWNEPLIVGQVDGPTLTAAAAASCIPLHCKGLVLPNNFFDVPGKQLRVQASGRISCAVTTPGTGRLDFRLGGVIAFDSLAFNLNIVAKVNVGWYFDLLLTCRAVGNGTACLVFPQATFTSEANVGAPLPTVGGATTQLLPISTAPAVGTGFDGTSALSTDLFWTPSLATASFTLHQYVVTAVN